MNIKTIEILGQDNTKAFAIVDADLFEFLNQWKWSLSEKGYARRTVKIHGIVADVPDCQELQGDHINGNRLDNRRENLRIVTRDHNARNRFVRNGKLGDVKFKGVYANKNASTYTARIRKGEISHYLGSFRTQEEAAMAYDAAAIEIFGEHAKINFPANGINSCALSAP